MEDSQGKGIQKKNNFAINISKGGGIGIGVGIILVGGALLVNSFQKKPPKNPIKKNHDDHSSSAENQKTSAESTYDQHLISDGTEKATGSGDSREILAQNMLQDGDHKFEGCHGKEDHLNCDGDDQEITGCSKERNGSVVETEQLSSSIITDSLLQQPAVSSIDNQETGEEANVAMLSSIEANSGLIDHDDEERGSIADTAKLGQDDDLIAFESFEDSKVNEIPEEASEEVNMTMLSSIEVNSGLIDHDDQESGSIADTAKHGKDDDLLNLKLIEDSKINEIPEAVHEDNSKNNAEILVSESEENVCSHSDGSLNIIKEEEMNGTFEASQYDGLIDEVEEQEAQHEVQIEGAGGEIDVQDSNDGLLTTSDAGVSDKIELLEEPIIEEEPETPKLEEKEADSDAQTNAETEVIEEKRPQNSASFNAAGETVEDKEIQPDVQTKAAEIDSSIEHMSKLTECQVIKEAIEDKEEKEIDVHTNAEGGAAGIDSSIEHTSKLIECQVIEEAIEDKEEKQPQHDVHINAADEAAEINPGSKKSSELMEIQTILDQDHSHVSHQITPDNILPQENDQNISMSELSNNLPELNPATGLKIDSKDVGIDLHSIEPVTEKDIICQETDESSQDHPVTSVVGENNEGGSQAVIVDNVEESSEGSSVHEIPMQLKDQTEKLQENGEHVTLQKTEKEIHYKEIEDVAISSENIQTGNIDKGISNMNFFKKYMVKVAEQNDEKMSLLMRKRGPIVIGTMSALLWPLCYSYFGLPFLKICLIAVLVMVLSKIQGF